MESRSIGFDLKAVEASSYERAHVETDSSPGRLLAVLLCHWRSGGRADHHVTDAEHWGSGIVHSDCRIQLWVH